MDSGYHTFTVLVICIACGLTLAQGQTTLDGSLENRVALLEKQAVAKSKRLALGSEGPVAFHAVVAQGVITNIGRNQTIVFNETQINLGGGYHNQHGIFIAPVSDVYIFSTSITSYVGAYSEVQVQIKKDGVTLAGAYGHGDNGRHDQGSVTVVTQLAQGNEVWVSLGYPSGDTIFGSRYTSFMGCLVHPL